MGGRSEAPNRNAPAGCAGTLRNCRRRSPHTAPRAGSSAAGTKAMPSKLSPNTAPDIRWMISPCHASPSRMARGSATAIAVSKRAGMAYSTRRSRISTRPSRQSASHRPDRNRAARRSGRRAGSPGTTGSPGNNSPLCDVAPRCRPSASIRNRPSARRSIVSGPLIGAPARHFGWAARRRRAIRIAAHDEVEVFERGPQRTPVRIAGERFRDRPPPRARWCAPRRIGKLPGTARGAAPARSRLEQPAPVRFRQSVRIAPSATSAEKPPNQPCDDLSSHAPIRSSAPVSRPHARQPG